MHLYRILQKNLTIHNYDDGLASGHIYSSYAELKKSLLERHIRFTQKYRYYVIRDSLTKQKALTYITDNKPKNAFIVPITQPYNNLQVYYKLTNCEKFCKNDFYAHTIN